MLIDPVHRIIVFKTLCVIYMRIFGLETDGGNVQATLIIALMMRFDYVT